MSDEHATLPDASDEPFPLPAALPKELADTVVVEARDLEEIEPEDRDAIFREAARSMISARDEIRAYRAELFDPGGLLLKLSAQFEKLLRQFSEHDANEQRNYAILRRQFRVMRTDVDSVSQRVTAVEEQLDATDEKLDRHDRRLLTLEGLSEAPDTTPPAD